MWGGVSFIPCSTLCVTCAKLRKHWCFTLVWASPKSTSKKQPPSKKTPLKTAGNPKRQGLSTPVHDDHLQDSDEDDEFAGNGEDTPPGKPDCGKQCFDPLLDMAKCTHASLFYIFDWEMKLWPI